MCLTVTPVASATYRFGDLLALARGSWIRQVRERVEALGFPGYRRSDSWALRLLASEAQPIGRLGEEAGISRQAARKFADGLVERGHATFASDPSDRRRTLVVLTADGEAYVWAVTTAQRGLNNAIRKKVSDDQLAAADAVLRAVLPTALRSRIDATVPPPMR